MMNIPKYYLAFNLVILYHVQSFFQETFPTSETKFC